MQKCTFQYIRFTFEVGFFYVDNLLTYEHVYVLK